MKNTKLFLKLLFFIVFLTQTTQAQETAKKGKSLTIKPDLPTTFKGIKDQGIKTHQHKNGCCQYKVIYLGGGFNNPSASNNQRLYGNYSWKTLGLTLDYSQTILRKPGFSIGFNLGGQYFTGSGNPFGGTLPEPYKVIGQISNEVTGSGDTKNSGYFAGVGPQFNFHFANRFVFSPIFQVGYLNVTQNNFKATQTVLMQGFALPNYTKTYDLISQTETKTSGLGIIPKARLSYMISRNIGLWAEASYLLGPTVKNNVTTFKPQSDPTLPPPSSYTIGQMDAGTYKTVVNESKYNALGFNAGLVFSFKGKSSVIKLPPDYELKKKNTQSKSCFASANLTVDKFKCCNDTLTLQGHFDLTKSVNTIVDNIIISKITDSKGVVVKNFLALPLTIKSNGIKSKFDYFFDIKIDGSSCKKDLHIEYEINTTCTIKGLKESFENIETKIILEKDIPCCNCDKTKAISDESTERNIHQYPGGGHAVVGNENTRKKACFAEATLITNKFKCCENQILIEGFFDVYNSINTVVNNITITKITDNKGNPFKNTLTLPFKTNPKGISKGYKFPIEFKLDNSACQKDVVIEYQVNAICTINKIEKVVQYTYTKTILENELPCCGCDNGNLSDTSEDKCENNPIVNGDFSDTGIINGAMPTAKLPKWDKGYGSPKVFASQGCLDNGYVELSGNKLSGNAISQILDSKIIAGRKYKVTVAVKFNKVGQSLDYGKIRVVAFNGVLPTGNSHPIPQTNIAIIGRSPQVQDCGDWAFIEFPIWKANKDFDNIAINAFTNEDNVSSIILIDNISFCETLESGCLELEVDALGNPLNPTNLGTVPSNFTCTTYDDEDEYFNGNLTDLYEYDGTFGMYEQNFSEDSGNCFNLGGDEIPDETAADCDAILQAAGITETCAEVQALIDSVTGISQQVHNYPLIQPLTNIPPGECKSNNLKGDMAFGGRDIIFVNGLMMSHILDRAKGISGAMADWPVKAEFQSGGYYKEAAETNFAHHIENYLLKKGYSNRYLVVSYNCSQDAETGANAIASQIRDAMETGLGVTMNVKDLRFKLDSDGQKIATCFGKEYVIISHSTGGMVANIMLSLANKTKKAGTVENIKYGDISYLSDRCSGHIAMHSAIAGSNVAALAVAIIPKMALGTGLSLGVSVISALSNTTINTNIINPAILAINIPKSILVDLSPKIMYPRWGNLINQITVPVLTVSGNHPSGVYDGITKPMLYGLDDGVVNTESSSGRNQISPSIFSLVEVSKKRSVYDMGIPTLRAIRFYRDQHESNKSFYSNSSPYISATGMVYSLSSKNINNQFNNHFTFLQAADQHMIGENSKWFDGDYPKTFIGGARNYEEELVTNSRNLYKNGTINPLILSEMGEFIKSKSKRFPKFSVKTVRKGILIYPKICCTWIPRIIWKRTYHRLKDDNLYDMDYAYKYLFTN